MQVNNYILKCLKIILIPNIIKEVVFLIYTMWYIWVTLGNRRNV